MLYPFILTTLAGFATLIGTIPIFVKIKNKDSIIASGCAFASGVMLCVSVIDLIPEAIRYLNNFFNSFFVILFCFIFLLIGIIISMFMDNTIDKLSKGSSLFKIGILSMIAIILHNIPEDCIYYVSQ